MAGTAASAFGACANLLSRMAAARKQGHAPNFAGAAARLVEALPGNAPRTAPRDPWQRRPKVDAAVVVDLLTGLGAIDTALANRAADHILATPKTYGVDAVLVPAARALVGAGKMHGAASLERLRSTCVAHLRARTAEPLAPPADWQRTAKLACHCRNCAELARFLADPERQTWILKAAEAERSHVEGSIRQAQADLDLMTDRRGRPYSLVCTKNQASYERRARQRKQDLKDLALLAG